jgi:phenylacetate-CoA ligase
MQAYEVIDNYVTNLWRWNMNDNFLNYVKELPVYRTLYNSQIEDIELDNLANLPTLSKDLLKSTFPAQWMSEKMKSDISKNKIEINTTSGTSGKQLKIIRKKHWWQDEYARVAKVHPMLRKVFVENKPRAVLTTIICSNTFCSRTAIEYENRIINNTLHMNTTPNPLDWQEKDIRRICDEWNRFKPCNLDADPIYLAIFLAYKDKFNIDTKLHQPEFITLCYEYCPRAAYKYIKDYFNVPTIQLYGSTELGYLYYKDDSTSNYKIFPELIDVTFEEINKSDRLYELIVTSAKNEYMPFVRYRTGDLVKVQKGFEEFIHADPMRVELEDVCGRLGDAETINVKSISDSVVDEIVFNHSNSVFLYKINVNEGAILFYYATSINSIEINKKYLGEALKRLFVRDDIQWISCENISPLSSGKFKILEIRS